MSLAGTEQEIVQALGSLKQARAGLIAHQLSISPDYAHYLCRQLFRGGYIECSPSGAYQLTSKGRQYVQRKTTMSILDRASIQAIAKEITKELKKKGTTRHAQRDYDDTREYRSNVMKEKKPEREEITIKQDLVNVTEDFVKSYTCNFDKGIAEKRVSGAVVKGNAKKLKTISV